MSARSPASMRSGLPDRLAEFQLSQQPARAARIETGWIPGGASMSLARRWGRRRVGVFLGTSTSGILETELAYRRRDPGTGALPADFDYRGTHNSFSVADFARQQLGARRAGRGRFLGVLLECEGVRIGAADDGGGLDRRGAGGRSGLAVPDDFVWIPLAATGFATCPAGHSTRRGTEFPSARRRRSHCWREHLTVSMPTP